MKNIILLTLSLCLLQPAPGQAQQSGSHDLGTPDWVYLVSASAVVVIGGIWCYKNFVKSPASPTGKTFKQNALDEIRYISTSAQYDALKKLEADAKVQDFMEQFWLAKDPTPGTPANELREEYYLRWEYVNQHFADHREGWKTDRGRAYLIYGPPDEIEHVAWAQFALPGEQQNIESVEAWLYYRPATGIESLNIFSNYNPGTAKFIFADFEGTGFYVQLYSSERDEISDPRVFIPSTYRQ